MVAFKAKDHSGSGFISVKDFYDIMVSIKSHLLTEPVKMNLIAAAQASGGSQTISYPYFMAFISLLSNIELIKKIYLNATNGSRSSEVTKGRYFYCGDPIQTQLKQTIKLKICNNFQRSFFTRLKWCLKLLLSRSTFYSCCVIFFTKLGRLDL